MTNDEIWAAGVISAMGSMSVRKVIRKQKYGQELYIKLEVASVGRTEVVVRLAAMVDKYPRTKQVNGKDAASVTISGDTLHEFMKRIWPELTKQRKHEYAAARKATEASKIDPWKPYDGEPSF